MFGYFHYYLLVYPSIGLEPFHNELWIPGEPNNNRGDEYYVTLFGTWNGIWGLNDHRGTDRGSYICEFEGELTIFC